VLAEADHRAHPRDAHAAYVNARIGRAFEDFDNALKYAEIAVALDPRSSAYHRELALACMHQVEKTSLLKAISMMRRTRTELDAALALAPNDPDNLYERMDFLLQAPSAAGGDKKRASEIASQLMKLDPVRGNLALARIAWKQKEFDKLEGFYRNAVESNPRSYEARIALANLYLGNRASPEDLHASARANFTLAEQHASAALDLNPDRIDAYRILAVALANQKRWDDAARILARAEAAIPDDLAPYVFTARAALHQGIELAKAETYLRKYLTQTRQPEAGAPSLAAAHRSLGSVYEKEGRTSDARSELETVRRDLRLLK
jgi:tetratricopeptide (TPR) repeat protein